MRPSIINRDNVLNSDYDNIDGLVQGYRIISIANALEILH